MITDTLATIVGAANVVTDDAGRAFLSGYEIPLESLATVEISDNQVSIVETSAEEDSQSEWARDQQELDRLLSSDGRINLDFTVGVSPDAVPDAAPPA